MTANDRIVPLKQKCFIIRTVTMQLIVWGVAGLMKLGGGWQVKRLGGETFTYFKFYSGMIFYISYKNNISIITCTSIFVKMLS